jgi:hypothetical protein
MYDTLIHEAGGYRFAKGVFQYSSGVCSESGYRIERAQFASPVKLSEGIARIVDHLGTKGRPNDALCAMELRCPQPLSEADFLDFNRQYVAELTKVGLANGEHNSISRTKVAPKVNPPEDVVVWAFSYTTKAESELEPRDFVIAGSGEAPEGQGNYRDHVIRPGDQSPDGLREKARWVLGEMERRMASFGVGWQDVSMTQLYTLYDVHSFIENEIVRRAAMPRGLLWHFARPPVAGLDYEMDVRGVRFETII